MSKQANPRAFYRMLHGENARPLPYNDPYYVPRLADRPDADPILALKTRIDWASTESVNILTGYRGNGKSTELLRLQGLLEAAGCRVFLVNMLDYVMMSTHWSSTRSRTSRTAPSKRREPWHLAA